MRVILLMSAGDSPSLLLPPSLAGCCCRAGVPVHRITRGAAVEPRMSAREEPQEGSSGSRRRGRESCCIRCSVTRQQIESRSPGGDRHHQRREGIPRVSDASRASCMHASAAAIVRPSIELTVALRIVFLICSSDAAAAAPLCLPPPPLASSHRLCTHSERGRQRDTRGGRQPVMHH